MRLDIGMFGSEKFTSPFYGNFFYLLNKLTPAVVLFIRVTLSVFIGKDRTLYLQQGAGDEVF